MTEQELIDSASQLPKLSQATAEAFGESADRLAAALSARMLASGNVEALIGFGNLNTMTDTHRRQARFLGSLLADFDPRLLVRTIAWAAEAHRAMGFQDEFWIVQVDAWKSGLPDELGQLASEELAPLFNWLGNHLPHIVRLGVR